MQNSSDAASPVFVQREAGDWLGAISLTSLHSVSVI